MKVNSIALLGHKDHGKSTLIGSLLMQTGAATKVRIKEAEAYSKRLHRPFEPAFILDSFPEERERGMTYDTTRAEIKYKGFAFSLIDVPGHEELMKNMISGASYGETALLLVSAKSGEGIRNQTQRHLFVCSMLGIKRLIVAVNKMDLVGYSQKRFDAIGKGLAGFISAMGFEKGHVRFVPISAYKGDNLTGKSSRMEWYRGKSLIEELYDNARLKHSSKKGMLRILVQGSIPSEKAGFAAGRVVSGDVKVGERVIMLPGGEHAVVKEIVVKGRRVRSAGRGDNVALGFRDRVKGDLRGSVIYPETSHQQSSARIEALIFLTKAFTKNVSIRFNGIDVKVRGMRVNRYIDTTTGRSCSSGRISPLNAVRAELRLARKIPVERFDKAMELGRFVMYNGNKFIGIGIVTAA